MLDVEFALLSHAGRSRGHNEDYLGSSAPGSVAETRSHGWLFALADGVGGQDRGEVASRVAVEKMIAGFRSARPAEPLSALLGALVRDAHSCVLETGMAAAPGGVNMATTMVACALRFDRVLVAHCGDSRCYLIRKGGATQLTRDHTLVSEQVRMGVMSAREAALATTKHLLTRSLGTGMSVNADLCEHQVFPGDVLALCSDGLHGAVETADFARFLTPACDLPDAVARLVALANDNDGSDNISLIAARVRAVERVGMYRGRPYKLR